VTNPTWPPQSSSPPADEDQRRAAEAFRDFGKLLVEASPGTGKTFLGVYLAVCAKRLGWTSAHRRSLFLTFSRNARVRIEEEVGRYIDSGWASREELRSVRVLNYHAFFLEVLRKKAGFWGCRGTLRPASLGERRQSVETVLAEELADEALTSEAAGQATLAYALRRFDVADLSAPDSVRLLTDPTIQKLCEQATSDLREGRPHYDDFAPLVLNLLEHCPELQEWLRAIYPVVILDEFQDTDIVQWAIVRTIHPERIVVLLDRFQMIYEWRGSRTDRISQARQEFGIPNEAERELTQIHRVGDEADLAGFIQGLRGDDLRGQELPAQRSHPWLTPHAVTRWEKVTSQQWERIPDEVKCLTTLRSASFHRPGETTAVLTRSNFLADYLYNRLRLRTDSGRPLHCRWIGERSSDETLRDLVWQLRGIGDPWDLRGWFGGLLDAVLPRQFLRHLNLTFRHELACDGDDLLKGRRRAVLCRLRESLALWWDAVRPGNYSVAARALSEIPNLGKALLENNGYLDSDLVYFIVELGRAAGDFASNPDAGDWQTFCDHLENRLVRSVFLRLREPARGLFIMTIHQSKGREFDHIILPWLSDTGEPGEVFPHRYQHNRFEDRRLLYVALTRARSRVTIVFPREHPSEFLGKWGLYADTRPNLRTQLSLW